MNTQGKVWGLTQLLLSNKTLEMHRIGFNAGSKCSKHKHNTKFNLFYVLAGSMLVRTWKNDYDLVDETILSSGQFTTVKPGEYHQFEGLSDGEALELYWSEFDPNDIVRDGVGMV